MQNSTTACSLFSNLAEPEVFSWQLMLYIAYLSNFISISTLEFLNILNFYEVVEIAIKFIRKVF